SDLSDDRASRPVRGEPIHTVRRPTQRFMSLPEITALCRVLARSDARDHGQQMRNLERVRELRTYLGEHSDPGTVACLDAAAVLTESMARGSRLEEKDLLEIVCKLMATVEKHWCGPDPDAVIADALYGAPQGDVD